MEVLLQLPLHTNEVRTNEELFNQNLRNLLELAVDQTANTGFISEARAKAWPLDVLFE
jgi:hypothetical protein